MNSPIGFILGSGWGGIIEKIKIRKEEGFKSVFGHKTTVLGHAGKIIYGSLFEKNIILLSGRYHTYEGYTPNEATKTIRYLHEKGVRQIIITSASGGLNPKYQVGDLVLLTDVVTLFCQSPLTGPQFPDLSQPFNPELNVKAEKAAVETGFSLHKGIYVYLRGPHYETYSDKMALRFLGADVVGMSTVPEVIMASHLGMQILGLPMVTNLAFVKHNHRKVLQAVINQTEKLNSFFLNLIKIM